MSVLVLLVLALLVSSAQAASEPRACRADLPRGPAVPAPVVFRNSCGSFRLARDGTLTQLPRRWLARHSAGAGRTYGADLRIERTRRGRIILSRRGKVVWRSSGLYYRDGGSVAFGPGAFAFASWRRGIFATDLESPERLIARGVGLHPVAYLRGGELLVVKGGWGPSVSVHAPDGSLLRRYRYRPKNGYVYDERAESFFLVTPGRVLSRVDATGIEAIRRLGRLDGWLSVAGGYLTLSDFAHRGRVDETRFTVLGRDGPLLSRWSWRSPRDAGLDYGPTASDDARMFAFRTVRRPRGAVVVYVLRAGEAKPTAVLRHRGAQLGCGVGASFSWHRRALLYAASDGPTVIVDIHAGTRIDLTRVATHLPSRVPGERGTAHWLSTFDRV